MAGRLLALGWVPQHPTVLAGTVLDNIALGRPGIDECIARAVLEAVQLGPWLRSRPHGLRTPLSGLDAPLSLGERRTLVPYQATFARLTMRRRRGSAVWRFRQAM